MRDGGRGGRGGRGVLEGGDRIATAHGFPLYRVSGGSGACGGRAVLAHYFEITLYFKMFYCRNVRRESCGVEQLRSALQKISDERWMRLICQYYCSTSVLYYCSAIRTSIGRAFFS